jgi:hypothetical protein
MSLTLVDGEILRVLSEDIAEGQFDYLPGSGLYNRVVVVGATDAPDADTDRVGLLRGSKVHFRTDSIGADYIPVINVRASEALLLSPKVIDESGNFLVDETGNNVVGG